MADTPAARLSGSLRLEQPGGGVLEVAVAPRALPDDADHVVGFAEDVCDQFAEQVRAYYRRQAEQARAAADALRAAAAPVSAGPEAAASVATVWGRLPVGDG